MYKVIGVDITVRRGPHEVDVSTGVLVHLGTGKANIVSLSSLDPRWQCSGLTEEEQHGAVCAAWEQVGAALRTAEVPS